MISNLAYTRFSLIQPDVEIVRDGLEKGFISQIAAADAEAVKLHNESKEKAVAYLTKFSGDAGAHAFNTYQAAYQNLFMKYMDGNVKYKIEGEQNPKVEQPGYSEPFLRKIAEETGDKLKQQGHDEH
jgi:hypothetical protein